jgi:anhydro-N-acetylmuramic acid kinase
MDVNGTLAATGEIDQTALKELLTDPYFGRPAPKSLDRNHFSENATSVLAKTNPADDVATLTAFTAQAVLLGLRNLPQPPLQFLVCGGGRKNKTLMKHLQTELKTPVNSVESVGWCGDAMEAQLFAFLSVRSRYGLPISFPTTTGVTTPTTGGRLFRAVHGKHKTPVRRK